MGTLAPPVSAVIAAIDVDGITRALDGAKEAIVQAIRVELRRQAPRPGQAPRFRLTPTPGMVDPLVALYERGRFEARAELTRAGVDVPRRYAEPRDRIRAPLLRLTVGLNGIAARAETDVKRATQDLLFDDVNELVRRRVDAAIDRVPGLRAVAASLVSESFISGTADLYEENADAFGGFVATSVLDQNTCPHCIEIDGTVYPTPAAAAEAGWKNGGFGPYEECDGRERCRCRIVPIPGGRTDRVVSGALPGEPTPGDADYGPILEGARIGTPGSIPWTAITPAVSRASGEAARRVGRGVLLYSGTRFRVERAPIDRSFRAITEDGEPLTGWYLTRREAVNAAIAVLGGTG